MPDFCYDVSVSNELIKTNEHSSSDPDEDLGRLMLLDDIELSFTGATEDTKRGFMTLIVEPNERARGGLGKIAKVHTVTGKLMACKMMLAPDKDAFPTPGSYEAEFTNREKAFREEYETLCKLSNFKGFVKAFGFAHVQGIPAILMEWVEGIPLSKAMPILGKGMPDDRIPALTVAQIGRDVFRLLARLEWQTELFVHRDISPANIMIRTSSRSLDDQMSQGSYDVCFIDFGSAAAMRTSDGTFTTITRILRGATPDYAPPEMLSNDLPGLAQLRKSSKIDVYATSSVMYRMLTGHVPYGLTANYSSDYLHKMQNPPLPTGLQAGSIEELLARIILRGMEPTQDARPNSFTMFKLIEHYIENYDENITRKQRGMEFISLNPRDVGSPTMQFEKVNFQQKLSQSVVADALAASNAETQIIEQSVWRTMWQNSQPGAFSPTPQAFQPPIYVNDPSTQMWQSMPAGGRFAGSQGAPTGSQLSGNQRASSAQEMNNRAFVTPINQMQTGGVGAALYSREDAISTSRSKRRFPFALRAALIGVVLVAIAFCVYLVAPNVISVITNTFGSSSDASNTTASDAGTGGVPQSQTAENAENSTTANASSVTSEDISKASRATGKWTGRPVSTSSQYACYGASEYNLVLDIGAVSNSGVTPIDVQVLYHGHDRSLQNADINSSPMDYYLTFDDLRATVDSGKLVLEITDESILGKGNSITVTIEVDDTQTDPNALEATVTSINGSSQTIDKYKLEKS